MMIDDIFCFAVLVELLLGRLATCKNCENCVATRELGISSFLPRDVYQPRHKRSEVLPSICKADIIMSSQSYATKLDASALIGELFFAIPAFVLWKW